MIEHKVLINFLLRYLGQGLRFPKQADDYRLTMENATQTLGGVRERYVVLRRREEQDLEPIDAGRNIIYCQCLRNGLICRGKGGTSIQSYLTIGVEIAACAGMDARPCVSEPAKVNMEDDGEKF